ncbi:MAG: hypothetical protein WA740_07930 [Candidatus Binataceae bacterium]
MNREISPRFRSAADALRFFFRISALLYGIPNNPRTGSCRIRRSDLAREPGALGDYLRIGACVGDLNAVQFLLLGEFYGPTCFAPRTRTGGGGRRRRVFPDCTHPERAAGTMRLATLATLRARLRRRRLVISAPAQRRGQFVRSPGTAHGPDHEKL